ncbi:hypothetical protein SLA2020_148430 [Shorea laevis]
MGLLREWGSSRCIAGALTAQHVYFPRQDPPEIDVACRLCHVGYTTGHGMVGATRPLWVMEIPCVDC